MKAPKKQTLLRESTVEIDLGDRSYTVVVSDGLLKTAGARMAPCLRQPRVVILTDEIVAALYKETLEESLDAQNISHACIVLPAGEQTKSFDCLRQIIDQLLEMRIERNTTLIALGGGVIGDLTGFAAAVTLRGLDFVQIPTTLLAQVDSSVGGKTGINATAGKNLIGAFHQPRLVLADTDVLSSLPRRQFRAGYAEVVKYGLIDDEGFFQWLEENGRSLCAGDKNAQHHAIVTSCKAKAAIVAGDEREAGQRALLNLGHTFGHALEARTGYSDVLLHGEGVAIGMALAFDLSERLGLCPPGELERVRRHLEDIGLPHGLNSVSDGSWTAEELLENMRLDKKVQDGVLTFVLVHGIGNAFICRQVNDEDVLSLLRDALGA